VKIQFAIFWVVTPCNAVLRFQRFKEGCRLHLQGEVASKFSFIIWIFKRDMRLKINSCGSYFRVEILCKLDTILASWIF